MSTVSGGRRRAFKSRHHAPFGSGGKLAVLFVSLALLLFVFAVMLGNYLRGLAVDIIEETTTEPHQTEPPVIYAEPPEKMTAKGILFGVDHTPVTATDTAEATEEETSDETGEQTGPQERPIEYDAVSMLLRFYDSESGKMKLSYSSELALEYSIDIIGDVDLSEGMELICSDFGEEIRTCGVFEVSYPNAEDVSRGIIRAYELALICELADAGIEEIVLVGFGEDADEGLNFISEIYGQRGKSTRLGLALSFELITDPNSDELIDRISKECGFIALDLYSISVPSLMTPESLISDRIARSHDVCRRYSVRVILGCGNDPDGDSQIRAATEAGADNLMVAIKR